MRVHQFHPVLAPGDAISNHVFALERWLRLWGHEPFAYAIEAKPGVSGVRPYRRLFRDCRPDDLLVLHYSMGHEVFDQLVRLRARRVLVYHNITPPEFFVGVNPHAAAFAALGRAQLRTLAGAVDLAVGVSEYNRRELEQAGFAPTQAIPILIDWEPYDVPADPGRLAAYRAPGTTLLFVGRIAPNKRQDDLIRMLAYYRRCVDEHARLVLIGSYRDQPQYHARLVALARALDLGTAVSFAGSVDMAGLVAAYQGAAVFVSLSEHEGFGVPLLEAMRFRVPIVAYDAAAVGETAGDAALLLPRKDLAEAAEACALVVERPALRDALVAAGERRLHAFEAPRVAALTRQAFAL